MIISLKSFTNFSIKLSDLYVATYNVTCANTEHSKVLVSHEIFIKLCRMLQKISFCKVGHDLHPEDLNEIDYEQQTIKLTWYKT